MHGILRTETVKCVTTEAHLPHMDIRTKSEVWRPEVVITFRFWTKEIPCIIQFQE